MKATKPLVIVVLGPTASGKTDLGISIAEKLKVDVHNIDSRQLYIGMDIGAAKPSKDQCKRVNHCLINLPPPDKQMNLYEFQELAINSLEKGLSKENVGLLVGGSGLYLKAITRGLQPSAVPPIKSLREQFNEIVIDDTSWNIKNLLTLLKF